MTRIERARLYASAVWEAHRPWSSIEADCLSEIIDAYYFGGHCE